MRRVLLSSVCVLLFTSTAVADALDDFAKILLPAYSAIPVRGVAGSSFSTLLQLFSHRPFRYFPATGDKIATARADSSLFHFDLGLRGSGGGRFIFVERSAESDVTFGYQLEASAAGLSTTTALPAIHEKDVRTGITDILNVPFTYDIIEIPNEVITYAAVPRVRRALWVYAFDDILQAKVRVRIFQSSVVPPPQQWREYTVSLDHRDGEGPTFPWYTRLNLEDICMPFSRQLPCEGFIGRVEIEPLSDRLRYSPMISVTDNVTQHVTILIPQ
jgi:hypothetical protein